MLPKFWWSNPPAPYRYNNNQCYLSSDDLTPPPPTDTIITNVTYADAQAVNISIKFVMIPSTSPVFTMSSPYSARNVKVLAPSGSRGIKLIQTYVRRPHVSILKKKSWSFYYLQYNKTVSVVKTDQRTTLGLPLYNYTVYITHSAAITDMAGWYDVYLQVQDNYLIHFTFKS